MNIKEIAERVARSHGTGGWQTLEDMVRYAKSLVAELAKENKPVAWYDGNKFYANEESASMACADMANLEPLFTLPPTAEQIEQELREDVLHTCHGFSPPPGAGHRPVDPACRWT